MWGGGGGMIGERRGQCGVVEEMIGDNVGGGGGMVGDNVGWWRRDDWGEGTMWGGGGGMVGERRDNVEVGGCTK